MICPATKRPGGNESGFLQRERRNERLLEKNAAALIVAGVFSTGALALDSAPTNEFEQKLKAYDLESIAAARQYARAADMKGMMARVAPTLRQQVIAGSSRAKSKPQLRADRDFRGRLRQSAFVDNAQAIETRRFDDDGHLRQG